ncbi:hypothetical protein SDC9_128307 [bioreactor metagenome]|uniref:Uncharacterized protein n=1 Tax=bioreactor metagenome TaxID=1076179 RepID=A0A645CWM0_9ZZZZ
MATTGRRVSTKGPLALYCLITRIVAAGAVAAAIEPKTKLKWSVCLKMKNIEAETNKTAPSDSIKVIPTTDSPNFLTCFKLN